MRAPALGALLLALCAPSVASAVEVTVDLRGAVVPVGPEGTAVLQVARSRVGDERFVLIRARAPELASRCGASPERVVVWGTVDGRWTEMTHEVVDRCLAPAPGARRRVDAAVRARLVDVVEAGGHRAELHLRLIDPRAPSSQPPTSRYRRVGDRFALQRVEDALAPTPGLGPQRALADLAAGRADGRLDEWAAVAPLATGDRGTLWMAQQGERVLVAGDLPAVDAEPPSLTVHLADVGVSTSGLRGADGARGRVLTFACGGGAGAEVRCERAGDRWHLEVAVDLTAQLYRRRRVEAVAVLAVAGEGAQRLVASNRGMRLEVVRLATPIDLLRGASREVIARCDGGLVGRLRSDGDDVLGGEGIACGERCRGGVCERRFGAGGVAGRVEVDREAACLRGLGPGAAEVDGCAGGSRARLVGSVAAQGFDAVLGVEREWAADGARWRQGEVWTLVTASAEWRRLTVGAPRPEGSAPYDRVGVEGGHPVLCAAGGGCDALAGLTLRRREEPTDSVTGDVVATLREAGLLARREAE
jgi:hypothetical protein